MHPAELQSLQQKPPTAAVSFTNSWTDFGAPFETAGYYKDSASVVHLKGVIKSGVIGSSAFTLPAGFRPANTEIFAVVSNGALGRLDVLNDGTVVPVAGSNAYFSLSGASFRATL